MVKVWAVHILDTFDAIACGLVAELSGRGAVLVGVAAWNAFVGNAGLGLLAVAISDAVDTVGQITVADLSVWAIQGVDARGNLLTGALVANVILATFWA